MDEIQEILGVLRDLNIPPEKPVWVTLEEVMRLIKKDNPQTKLSLDALPKTIQTYSRGRICLTRERFLRGSPVKILGKDNIRFYDILLSPHPASCQKVASDFCQPGMCPKLPLPEKEPRRHIQNTEVKTSITTQQSVAQNINPKVTSILLTIFKQYGVDAEQQNWLEIGTLPGLAKRIDQNFNMNVQELFQWFKYNGGGKFCCTQWKYAQSPQIRVRAVKLEPETYLISPHPTSCPLTTFQLCNAKLCKYKKPWGE